MQTLAREAQHQPTVGEGGREGGREELGGRGWDEKGQGKRASLGKERVPFHASHRLERETLSLSLFFFSSSFSCFFPLFSFRVPFHASHRLTTFGITCLWFSWTSEFASLNLEQRDCNSEHFYSFRSIALFECNKRLFDASSDSDIPKNVPFMFVINTLLPLMNAISTYMRRTCESMLIWG